MITRSPLRLGAIAVLSSMLSTGCAQGTIGVSPGTIGSVLSTVIATIPSSTSTGGGRGRSHDIPGSPPPSAAASRVLRTGDAYRGVPYVWGGNTPRGFDCSGFTRYVFAKNGVSLPRTSREQAHVGRGIPPEFAALRPGDLMMFAEPGQAISHVAIYAGDGIILHASSSVGGVGYTDLNRGGEWFVQNFVVARRVL